MCGMHRFMLFTIFMAALWIIKPPTKTSSVRVRYNEWHRWFVFGNCLWIKVYTLIENKLTSFYVFMWNKALFIPLEEVCGCTVHKRAPALSMPKANRGSQMGWSSPVKKGNIWTSLCSDGRLHSCTPEKFLRPPVWCRLCPGPVWPPWQPRAHLCRNL